MKKILITFLTVLIAVLLFSTNIFADLKGNVTGTLKGQAQTGASNRVGNIKQINRIYISRGEFIAQLHKVLGIKLYYFAAPDIHGVFSDVSNDYKYAGQLYDMYSTGIIDDSGSFRPNDRIIREDALHYLVRAYNYKSNEAQVSKGIGAATDKSVKRGYLKDISQAQKLGLVEKEKNSAFKKPITRAEALSLIKRFEKLLDKQNNPPVRFLGPPVKKPADLGAN